MPDLITPEEGMSPVPDHSNDSGYEVQDRAPADVNADQDSFQDKDRQETLAQALEEDLSKAPWQKESAKGPLEDLEKITKAVKPIYNGFWHDKDQDILARLDQTARKLKEKRAAWLQDNKEDDTAVPVTSNLEKSCTLCNEPIGHHVLQCSKETLQDTLKEVIHSTPVGPLTGSPKVVHPFPEIGPQTLLPPSPRNSGQLLSKAELNYKDAHRPPNQGSPHIDHPDHPTQGHAEEDVTRRNPEPHQLSLNWTPV